MRTTIYVGGEQEGLFNLNDKQIKSLGIVLRGYANHVEIGNDDKIDSILADNVGVILLTTNGVEISSTFTHDEPLYSSINTESGEMQTYKTYKEAYDWQFYEERDGISDTLDKVITLLTEIKNDLNK
jgi:hypothetical protein